ncbi:DNA helicase UvrD [Candidatus Bipolaricaulota bacterium]|nr:DNA helicase UvrD [Candidatus Bipolaricaulota bacterium]
MRLVSDLHLHSRFSLATSRAMVVPEMAQWARWKGIDLLGTGDFTHPEWLRHLRSTLTPTPEGLYQAHGIKFMLSAEVAAVWRQEGKGRRVHLVLFAESFDDAESVARALDPFGKLESNGRPMLSVSIVELLDAIWRVAPTVEVIPAHVWTPWYSVFGSKSGFDSLEACFGPHLNRIRALETGLSSDPAMNRTVSSLDRYSLVSFSDAHSPGKLGREATVLELPIASYAGVIDALYGRNVGRIAETIEFHPQQGKYHFDGHRQCGVAWDPERTMSTDGRCPVCGKPLTLGVLHRIHAIADRDRDRDRSRNQDRDNPISTAPYTMLIPLEQILSQVFAVGVGTRSVQRAYATLISEVGPELFVLREATQDQLAGAMSFDLARAVLAVRDGDVEIEPGYDGRYGTVTIHPEGCTRKVRA